jgi:flagellar assembly factor FliW
LLAIDTSRFGTLEVDDNKVITFPDGLLGFSNLKHYILIDYKDTELKWLQSVDNPYIAFIVVEPTVLYPNYSINLDSITREFIQLKNNYDLTILVTIRVEGKKVIANLNGPLLLNATLMRGFQILIDKSKSALW